MPSTTLFWNILILQCTLRKRRVIFLTFRFKELQLLTSQTLPTAPIPKESWKYNELSADSCNFQKDLQTFSRRCPPGFDVSLFEAKSGMVKESVDYIRSKVKILELIQKGDYSKLSTQLESILGTLAEHADFLNTESIQMLVNVLLEEDRLEALQFARHILSMAGPRLDGDSCALLHTLLFPTIFDSEAAKLVKQSDRSSPNKQPDRGTPGKLTSSHTEPSDRASPGKPIPRHSEQPSTPPAPTAQPNMARTPIKPAVGTVRASEKCLMDLNRTVRLTKHAISMIDLEM
ncbi:hypothetical protein PSACC_00845 [Paramicrosporidium saccamoebae]|uniref:Uncharacterized protein n=1 Tax=Paramicrosporidium saccamoebae TaxID=1246581 RepID=A0A2H9TNL7_9FUNG|nr:hypothetical protein PSACC_00845 [Paramicrosporidium saccamoebae]